MFSKQIVIKIFTYLVIVEAEADYKIQLLNTLTWELIQFSYAKSI